MTSVTWGSDGPPRHPDGRAVITARLLATLTPLEVELYSGNALAMRLGRAVQWRTRGESIDGWDPEDFVQYGLDLAVRYNTVRPEVIVTWVGQQITRARTMAERGPVFEPVRGTGPGPEYVPVQLPDSVSAWVDRSLSEPLARAVKLVVERGLTQAEAAGTVGVRPEQVSRAFQRLRRKM